MPQAFLVGAAEQRNGEDEAQRLGGLHVDDKLNFGGSLYGQVGRLLALENAAGVDAGTAENVSNVGSVAYQSAGHRKRAKLVDRRNKVLKC